MQRIPEPHGDTAWFSAVILTTIDDRLDRTSLCYLENYFYKLAKDAGNYIVTNAMEPSSDHSIKAKDKRILAKYVEHGKRSIITHQGQKKKHLGQEVQKIR